MAKQSSSRNKRPTVAIIGIGRVGQAMAKALQSAGYPITSLVFHTSADARRARKLFPITIFPNTLLVGSDQLERLPLSDVLLITTPDDAIAETAQQLAGLHKGGRANAKRCVVLHTSGALSSEVLSPLAATGFSVGSIHPLVAIDPPLVGSASGSALRGAFYCIEGNKPAVRLAKTIALDLGGTPILIKPELKALYHAAAVIASPHLVALFDLAVQLMIMSGVQPSDARKMLLPLVDSTVKNLHAREPSLALTGTFARGDIGTVERHLKALSEGKLKPGPEALEIYKLLGLRSLQLAKGNGLDPKKIKQITKLLTGATSGLSKR